MAYLSGTVSNFQDLKSAIENACTSNGWALNSGVLSKGDCFIKLVANPSTATTPAPNQNERYKLAAYPGTTSSNFDTLNQACIINPINNPTGAIQFPLTYEISIFDNPSEVHVVVKYNSDFYQFLAWGKSDIPGIGGTGLWLTGSSGWSLDGGGASANIANVSISTGFQDVGAANNAGIALPYFFDNRGGSSSYRAYNGSHIHTGLDSVGWKSSRNANPNRAYGSGSTIAMLLTSLPNLMSQAAVLLPCRVMQWRNDGGVTIVANIRNVRLTRNDNIRPGEIIAYGSERWKVYPMYRKDSSSRDGGGSSTGVLHSGTYAIAIRYEGA